MKILKYDINEDQDFQWMIETEIVDNFGEDFIKNNIYQPGGDLFYLIATDEVHDKIKSIIFSDDFKDMYEGDAAKISDVTKDVLYNINTYDEIENEITDENVLVNFFYNYFDKDDVLDKILECGIENLNTFDRNILESAA